MICDILHFFSLCLGLVQFDLIWFDLSFWRKRKRSKRNNDEQVPLGIRLVDRSIEFGLVSNKNWVTKIGVLIDLSITIMIIFVCSFFSFKVNIFIIIFLLFFLFLSTKWKKSTKVFFLSFFLFGKIKEFPLCERLEIRLYFDIVYCLFALILIKRIHERTIINSFYFWPCIDFIELNFTHIKAKQQQQQKIGKRRNLSKLYVRRFARALAVVARKSHTQIATNLREITNWLTTKTTNPW